MRALTVLAICISLAGCGIGATESQLAKARLDAGVGPYGEMLDPEHEDGPGNDPWQMQSREPGLIDDDLDLPDGIVH